MEVLGNVDKLKKSIETKFDQKIKDIDSERKEQLAIVKKELKKKLELLSVHMKTATDSEAKKTYSMLLSTEKLKAKKKFEEKRESMIQKIFLTAQKKAKKVTQSDEYLEFVNKNKPENAQVIGDSYFKKHFPEIKADDNIIGVKFNAKGIVFDFTLDSMVASKSDLLRHEISQVLFK
jgi:vacuolar-type H+-ATPase subunit E/Vma4